MSGVQDKQQMQCLDSSSKRGIYKENELRNLEGKGRRADFSESDRLGQKSHFFTVSRLIALSLGP